MGNGKKLGNFSGTRVCIDNPGPALARYGRDCIVNKRDSVNDFVRRSDDESLLQRSSYHWRRLVKNIGGKVAITCESKGVSQLLVEERARAAPKVYAYSFYQQSWFEDVVEKY